MELYSFDTVGKYVVAVDSLDDGKYEAVVSLDGKELAWKSFPKGFMARDWGIGLINIFSV